MSEKKYTASVVYDNTNMHALSHAINNTFKFNLKLIYAVICIGLIVVGVFLGFDNLTGIVCIAFGCFLLPSINVMEKYEANQAIKRLNGYVPKVNYEFRRDDFVCFNEKERNTFAYSTIIRMVRMKEAYYLFPNPTQAYMIDRTTLKPQDEEGFEALLAEKVGLEWTAPNSFLTLSLKKIRSDSKNTRLKKA